MTFNINKHSDELIFIPLGGSGEIGMNFNLYYYKGKWLILDCGSGFAEDYLPGIDILVPDISYILKHKKDLLGIVVTHAHEDHIGALQHLWETLDCPLYTTPFTAEFLRIRFSENRQDLPHDIIELSEGSKTKIGPFGIDVVPLSHSAPEMQAVVIKTDLGKVFHTGDWKFDANPVVGTVNDEKLLAQYGKDGVLAVVGDSTNVFTEDHSGSEGELKESLIDIIAGCKNMVVVGSFASNVGRIESIVEAASKAGRQILLLGKSLKRVLKAARNVGYLKNMPALIDEKAAAKVARHKLLVLATGCQGEPLAAVTKLAHNTHQSIKLTKGDSVIFSSKIIHGNEKKIARVCNKLVKLGVEVLTERDHFVHVSGHPSRKELEKLYSLLKPEVVIPVHGEHVHMHEHAKLARKWGVKHAVEVENGSVLRLAPGVPEIVGKVEAGELAVYGHTFLKPDSNVMKARRKLCIDGFMVVILLIGHNHSLRAEPIIISPGYLDANDNHELISHLKTEIKLFLHERAGTISTKKLDDLEILVEQRVRSILKIEIGRVPIIEVVAQVA
jgi:ribonuclease J